MSLDQLFMAGGSIGGLLVILVGVLGVFLLLPARRREDPEPDAPPVGPGDVAAVDRDVARVDQGTRERDELAARAAQAAADPDTARAAGDPTPSDVVARYREDLERRRRGRK